MPILRFMKSERERVKLTNQQLYEIQRLYVNAADDFAKEIEKLKGRDNISSILRTQYLENYQKDLANELSKINAEIESNIKANIKNIANIVVKENQSYISSLGIGIKGAYSYIPDDVVKTIISGQLYQSDWTLSSAIWSYNQEQHKAIQAIIAKNITENKGVYDIAKELEKYVDPNAEKPWDWSRLYPGVHKKIDYNALRLARTLTSHAYQESFERATEKNPFVSAYKWNNGHHSRICPICIARAENDEYGLGPGIFPKGEVPLDHPNGYCYLSVVQTMSNEQVVDSLANWYHGTGSKKMNNQLDEFARSLGYDISTVKNSLKNI